MAEYSNNAAVHVVGRLTVCRVGARVNSLFIKLSADFGNVLGSEILLECFFAD